MNHLSIFLVAVLIGVVGLCLRVGEGTDIQHLPNFTIFHRTLYHFDLLPKHKLPVPVISVGNLTWGGNGKTPMVEFIANWFLNHVRVSPLILTRGYGYADEARVLQRYFDGTSVKIGVGPNRVTTADAGHGPPEAAHLANSRPKRLSTRPSRFNE